MNRLKQRVNNLEQGLSSDQQIASFWRLYKATLEKLPMSDRELVKAVFDGQAQSHQEPHRAALNRLDRALLEACAELDIPVLLTVNEMLL